MNRTDEIRFYTILRTHTVIIVDRKFEMRRLLTMSMERLYGIEMYMCLIVCESRLSKTQQQQQKKTNRNIYTFHTNL